MIPFILYNEYMSIITFSQFCSFTDLAVYNLLIHNFPIKNKSDIHVLISLHHNSTLYKQFCFI